MVLRCSRTASGPALGTGLIQKCCFSPGNCDCSCRSQDYLDGADRHPGESKIRIKGEGTKQSQHGHDERDNCDGANDLPLALQEAHCRACPEKSQETETNHPQWQWTERARNRVYKGQKAV